MFSSNKPNEMYACTLSVKKTGAVLEAGIEFKEKGNEKYVILGKGDGAKMLFFNTQDPPQVKGDRIQGLNTYKCETGATKLTVDDPNNQGFCVLMVGETELLSDEGDGYTTLVKNGSSMLIYVHEGKDVALKIDKKNIVLTSEALQSLIS